MAVSGSFEEFDKEEKITKMAKTDYSINEIISRRWSARAFSTRPVEKLKLLSILEAARWAPSSRNEQPWRYIVFTNNNPEKLKKAQSVLKEINDYAKRAPILICAITKRTYTDNGIPNRLHFHDLGAANEICFLKHLAKDRSCMKWEDLMYKWLEKFSIYLKTMK
jgi:nitroreductase